METVKQAVYKAARGVDFLAGFILMAVAALVVANVFMRVAFDNPITGTYELVGYLTAAAIGLSLAHCAVQNSHIAVGFLVDRLPFRAQTVVDIIVYLPATVLLGLVSWHLVLHANQVLATGTVSSTLQLPFYPFIFLVALGFLLLALVNALRLIEAISGGGDQR